MIPVTRAHKWQRGRDRVRKLERCRDKSALADLAAWNRLCRPRTKIELLTAKLKNANGGMVTYRMLGGSCGDRAFHSAMTRVRRANPKTRIVAVRGLGMRMIAA